VGGTIREVAWDPTGKRLAVSFSLPTHQTELLERAYFSSFESSKSWKEQSDSPIIFDEPILTEGSIDDYSFLFSLHTLFNQL
jgi:hypothetical protein